MIDRERTQSALAVALLHALLAYVFITGLGAEVVRAAGDRLKLFDVRLEPPPPPAEPMVPAVSRSRAPEGAAAPQGRKATPSPVVAPRRRPIAPSPLPAAPAPGIGSNSSAGASERPGPGPGSGGLGTGTGSGRAGSGAGGGGIATRARLIRGRIVDSDYPRGAWRGRIGGTVVARLSIAADGRVERCTVTQSSGNAELDATTCRLIERRFRYEPARDAEGKAVPSVTGWRQDWWLEPPGR